METERSIISSEAKLSSIAWVMFFAPFVKIRVKSDPDFTEEERDFIAWYIQVWFVNLIFLAIVGIASLFNIYLNESILSWIITICGIAIFIISVFSIFACANDLTMRKENETLMQNIQHKNQVIKAYTPVLNFILWFRQENYSMPYRWLKESILLRTIFVFGTLLLWNSFWLGVLIIILVRVVLLLLNVDIIPVSMKKAINSIFSCVPWEVMAYISAPIVSKIRKADYETVLQARKQWYAQWQALWIWIIIQYILFIGILYLLYREIDITINDIILLFAAILWIVRIIIFYINKKMFLRIPVLSEIISLIFH